MLFCNCLQETGAKCYGHMLINDFTFLDLIDTKPSQTLLILRSAVGSNFHVHQPKDCDRNPQKLLFDEVFQ